MTAYFAKRILLTIPILWGVLTLVFFMLRIMPTDPVIVILGPHYTEEAAEKIREEYHLNEPLAVQYYYYLKDMLRGDFGKSTTSKVDVIERVFSQIPRTAILAIAAITIATFFGISMGLLSAVYQGGIVDNLLRIFSLIFISMPSFVLAILISMFFGYKLGWFPINGYESGVAGWKYLCLPAIALGTRPMAMILRLTRASLLEVINMDYVRTARAKGVKKSTVMIVHALRNALIPVTTAISGSLAALLGGALFIEIVFSWPGLGKLYFEAINNSDFPVVQGTTLLTALIFVTVNLFMDFVYAVLDPRISYN